MKPGKSPSASSKPALNKIPCLSPKPPSTKSPSVTFRYPLSQSPSESSKPSLSKSPSSTIHSPSRTPEVVSPGVKTPNWDIERIGGVFIGIDGVVDHEHKSKSIQLVSVHRKTAEKGLENDLKTGPKLNIDEYIRKLMTCVAEDSTGQLKVIDHLNQPAIIEQICALAIESFKKDGSMLELAPNINVVGDIHGQYTDLLRVFERCGHPSTTRYLFLGDYVDRGPNSLETICLLLLLKIRYPNCVYMLRGNHECSAINRVYGFSDECESRFQKSVTNVVWGTEAADLKGTQVWYRFQDVFNWLPLTALIANKVLCMHGGISPDLKNLDQLRNLTRPIDPDSAGLHIDLLWSDPDAFMPCGEKDNQWGPSARGISSHFNVRAVNALCAAFGIDMIVRAHQVVQDGYEFFANRKLVTVFSAPNYCGEFNNCGAVMNIAADLQVSFQILKPATNAPLKKKKSSEVNFDDIDIDALLDGAAPEPGDKVK